LTKSFFDKLTTAIEQNNSLLCVGLDPEPRKYSHHFPTQIDTEALVTWGKAIIEQTADLVCCYKPNIAFYEQHGPAGLAALQQTIAAVPDSIPVLLDAKRGDIGSTAVAYARAAFNTLGADAVTVSPYLGQDSIAPFLTHPGKAVFVLCYTSNPSAQAIQEFGPSDTRLFEQVIYQAQTWGDPTQIAFVVGATQPQALARFRDLNQTHWILAPGIGAQGGDLEAALAAGLNQAGQGLIIPVSRAIIYADDPRQAAQALRESINQARQTHQSASQPTHSLTSLITQLHDIGCVQFGEFTLASGKQSPIYIDLRRMGASAPLLKQAARAYAAMLRDLTFDHIAGVPYAALPIGTAVALEMNRSLIYPRKEVKAHGTGKTVEGRFEPGDTAIIIEDLVTSAGSVMTAIETLEGVSLKISDVAVLIDREQGGPENLAAKGYRLHAALKMADILDVLAQTGRISAATVEQVKAYLAANR
jgi:uridine monophosphate synthetase